MTKVRVKFENLNKLNQMCEQFVSSANRWKGGGRGKKVKRVEPWIAPRVISSFLLLKHVWGLSNLNILSFFLACNTPRPPMSVHKKFQPNRSSRLASYTQHIYTNGGGEIPHSSDTCKFVKCCNILKLYTWYWTPSLLIL